MNLALTYSTNREKLETLVRDLKLSVSGDISISIHKVDLSSPSEIASLLNDIKQQHTQSVGILVANAGYGKRIVNICDIELDQFEHTFNVNLRAPFLLVKGLVNSMQAERWGRIIFISSIAASGGGINGCRGFLSAPSKSSETLLTITIDYAASKGGLTGMMKNLASRLAQYNISVNDVSPAMIENTGIIPSAAFVPEVVHTIPLGRLGDPSEVANVVTMFTKTGYVTGQSVVAGGGLR